MPDAIRTETRVRRLRPEDLADVLALDARLTGEAKPEYWRDVFARFLREERCIGLAAEDERGRLGGYLFGELRAFEFGSRPCGWVFAVGVRRETARAGIGSALLAEASRLFRGLGVDAVRTMVPRTDVPLLAFFRRHGFVGGPFVQLELDLDGQRASGAARGTGAEERT